MVAHTQLPLPMQLRDEATLENFLPLDAAAALMPLLQAQLEPEGEHGIFVHGAPATGKSHLLQACCHRAAHRALYLPLAELAAYAPEAVLEGVEDLPLTVIDDLHRVAGQRDWEVALFNALNRVRGSGNRVLVAARGAPRTLDLALEDLRSRLSWGVVYQLPAPSDAEKQAILRFRAGRRGLAMPREVAAYITGRAPRSLPDLLQILDRLDRQSLAHQRALTIPFIKQVCNW